MFDPPAKDFECLAGLIELPRIYGRLAELKIFEELLGEEGDGPIQLMFTDEAQEPLHMDTPPVKFAVGKGDPLIGPQAAEPRRIVGWEALGGRLPLAWYQGHARNIRSLSIHCQSFLIGLNR